MSVGDALRDLGEFLDECEDEGAVTSVELTEGSGAVGSGSLTAEVELELSTDEPAGEGRTVSLRETRVDSEGGLRLTFESVTPVVPTGDHDVDVDVADATAGGDGTITATLSASATVDDDTAGSASTADEAATTPNEADGSTDSLRERDVPPFRDPELLEEVYASCDTFAEMTDAIGMDVTAETVRRYMIDHDIHEPNSYDTAGAADADGTGTNGAPPETDDTGGDDAEMGSEEDPQQVVLADGIGLPDDVTVETLIETVKRSNTIYEVTRNIGIERQDALAMLRELNLLDLVVGRLSTEAERDISRDEIVERLREASATA